MGSRTRLALAALAVLSIVGGAAAWMRARAPQPQAVPPAGVHAVKGLLHAEPFRLEQAYVHNWRREAPRVEAGWIVVLEVERELAVRRQMAEPVLYVGDQTAERVNHGDVAGRLVAIVPGELDPAADPAWFGAPELPERVDAAAVTRELAAARAARVPPLAALAHGGALGHAPVALVDRTALQRHAAELVLRWAPEERDHAEGLLAPLVE